MGLSASERQARIAYLRRRDGDNCWLCLRPMAFEREVPYGKHNDSNVSLDHVVERRNGGHTTNANLRLAHRGCNNKRDKKFPHTAGPLAPGNVAPGNVAPEVLEAQAREALAPNAYDHFVLTWAQRAANLLL